MLTETFTVAALDDVLAKLKTGTAAGYDNLFPEFLLHLGPGSKKMVHTIPLQSAPRELSTPLLASSQSYSFAQT